VDLTTGKWTGDVEWPQNCVGSSHVQICFDISAISTSGDADGDGLLDSWEQNGFNADGDSSIDVDLPGYGANPYRRDIFVEVDCMLASDHSHCPGSEAIADVVRSFANAPVVNEDGTVGVQLHVDVGEVYGSGILSIQGTGGVIGTYGNLQGGGNWIPEAGNEFITFPNLSGNGTDFNDLKELYFDSNRNTIFRYAIFGHQIDGCRSGYSNAGRNFLVALGGVTDELHTVFDQGLNFCNDGFPLEDFDCWCRDTNGHSVGSRFQQAGTFMHELGHTLGLQHDGDQADYQKKEVNNKPNYLSIMTHAFQFCNVPASSINPGLAPGGCDYSRIHLGPLNETNLDECAGIGGGLGFGTKNWNSNGQFEGVTCLEHKNNVEADINNDGVCVGPGDNGTLDSARSGDDALDRDGNITDGPDRLCNTTAEPDDIQTTPTGTTPEQAPILTGYEDWHHLKYSLLAGGGSGSTPVADEADPKAIERSVQFLSDLLAPSIALDKTGPATGVPGDLLAYTVEIKNDGRGPAIAAVLTDTSPDGIAQTSDLGVIVVGNVVTRTSYFAVPANACPGDFTGATASLAFKDFVGTKLSDADLAPLEILDVAAPSLSVSVSPSILWPAPDHKLRVVTATVVVNDNCDSHPKITLVSVTSNEPETGYIGAGDKGPDIQGAALGTDDRSFSLRAERATFPFSTGRVYTITYRAVDASGNESVATATVAVPRDISGQH
jgi:uncharacterized repeat protein (TIGR01451 family)